MNPDGPRETDGHDRLTARRRFLSATSATAAAGFAGCIGSLGGGGGDGDSGGGDGSGGNEGGSGDGGGGTPPQVVDGPDQRDDTLPWKDATVAFEESAGSVGTNDAEWLEAVGWVSAVEKGGAPSYSPSDDSFDVQFSVRNTGEEAVDLSDGYDFEVVTYDENGEELFDGINARYYGREPGAGETSSLFIKSFLASGAPNDDVTASMVASYGINVACPEGCPGAKADRSRGTSVDGDPVAGSSVEGLAIANHRRNDTERDQYRVEVTVENTGDRTSGELYDYGWSLQVHDEFGNPLVDEADTAPTVQSGDLDTTVDAGSTGTVYLKPGSGYTSKPDDVGFGWYEIALQCPEDGGGLPYCG